MKKRFIACGVILIFAAACVGNGYKVVGSYDPTQQAFSGVVIPGNANSVKNCPPLPETFQESDLVGTWEYFGVEPGVVTLTLLADGMYNLVCDYPYTGYHYEGDWKRWELERRENGTAPEFE